MIEVLEEKAGHSSCRAACYEASSVKSARKE